MLSTSTVRAGGLKRHQQKKKKNLPFKFSGVETSDEIRKLIHLLFIATAFPATVRV